ncbi:MAG: peroxiredoxin [Melioribacteraceae bacterium]|nr:peroxiredoxin [Melioribacteraceae bacterium]
MVEEGKKAPAIKLKNQDDKTVSLNDFKDQNIVLYFYPKDNTSGCTKEACNFRDEFPKFGKLDAVIIGVSPDSVESHKKFAEKYNLPFDLLSDSAKSVAKLYNSNGFLMAKRNTFLIDKDGEIYKIYKNVDVTTHTENILIDFSKLENL